MIYACPYCKKGIPEDEFGTWRINYINMCSDCLIEKNPKYEEIVKKHKELKESL